MNHTTTNEPAGIDLDKLEALARAATPGPWEPGSATLTTHRGCEGSWWEMHSIMMAPEGKTAHWQAGFVRDESNAAFIAAANPATILALIAQARASQPEGAAGTTGAQDDLDYLLDYIPVPAARAEAKAKVADLRAQLAASTENLRTAVRQAWEANAELSKLRAAPASAQPDRGAAHAQQEAAPAEVTKSQERDYNWLLGLAKSKGYQTVYGALYAAPTAVPYLGILPSHSEREAASAGGLARAVEDALREENRGTSGRLILDFHAEKALRDALSQSHAIAAGQEAANAKNAARPIPDAECAQGSCARGKDGCKGRCCLAGHKLPIVADIDSAAMAAVGAAGQEGGDK